MTQEMLEILIGKYLDSEITPSEQRMLEAELERDPQAKELLRQLQHLHERSCEAVTSAISEPGRTAEDVFEQAWQQQSGHPLPLMMRKSGTIRFATGVAAGLLIGLALHFVLPSVSKPPGDPVAPGAFVQNTDDQASIEETNLRRLLPDPADNVFRNVDWYSFTDREGNQWLVEGLREDVVRPAAYSGDL
jgi:hypothetical protein